MYFFNERPKIRKSVLKERYRARLDGLEGLNSGRPFFLLPFVKWQRYVRVLFSKADNPLGFVGASAVIKMLHGQRRTHCEARLSNPSGGLYEVKVTGCSKSKLPN